MSSEELRANFSELAVGSQTRSQNQTNSSGDPSSDGACRSLVSQRTFMTSPFIFRSMHGLDATQQSLAICMLLPPLGQITELASPLYLEVGGSSDNTGSGMARRLVLKTGLNIVLACNIPKDSPMLEAAAERKVVEKLRSLGYIKSKAGESSTSDAH